ncbi:glucose dehydrogenase [FAD, quinone] isoform X1 [Diabrotica virgifera virgifera]|uniref:Glucose dehydrogenase [FAD, quinone]-like isoform X1 n=2 Tax=Diabrotica virgifera virgifera TaxID=50390 RepID=A0A6P7F8K4_DIAVI|nr:glucose dehydrogenase [FAD, quinone] isoform X1 [Diabrotica virgifera virgifera]
MFLSKEWFLPLYTICVTFFGLLLYLSYHTDIFCLSCDETDNSNIVFDYIVVGCGSAGAIAARRLAENTKIKVLVLEAGKHGNFLLDVPVFGLLLQQSAYDWQYQSIPQTNSCFGLQNNVSMWPMGKIMGGTGMLNNMIYVRGYPEDFNHWFKDKEGYEFFKDILPYFKRLEEWDYKGKTTASTYVSNLTFTTKLADSILNAAKELGYPLLDETENCIKGFGLPKINVKNGQRWTPAHTLLEQKMTNIILRTNRVVQKILLHDNFEAYGVKYAYKGQEYVAKATKGVILSAGVIGTTKILLHSGIGPKKHLNDINIETKIDLPVGENLQDHLTTGFDLILFNQSLGIGIEYIMSPFSPLEYLYSGTGPWTTAGCEALAYFSTKDNQEAVPDLQFMVMNVGVNEDRGLYLRHMLGVSDEIWDKYFAKLKSNVTATILPILLHPKSRGNVRLESNRPNSAVLIDPKYLSHEYDIDILIKGIEIVRKLVETREMKNMGASFNTNIFPGCSQFDFGSKEYWRCYVQHLTITSYHPVGTCKMGHEEDETSVVNYDFEVKGTNNLFVVDGSVMPTLTSGNINGAIFLLAEIASDIFKYKDFLSRGRCIILEIFIESYVCKNYY